MSCQFQSRKFTNKILELVEEGMLDKEEVIRMCLMWMSERDVAEMYQVNWKEQYESDDEDEAG